MARRDRPVQPQDQRAQAVRRLSEVVMERRRLRDGQGTTKGKSTRVGAKVSLHAADSPAKSERGLKSVSGRGK